MHHFKFEELVSRTVKFGEDRCEMKLNETRRQALEKQEHG